MRHKAILLLGSFRLTIEICEETIRLGLIFTKPYSLLVFVLNGSLIHYSFSFLSDWCLYLSNLFLHFN